MCVCMSVCWVGACGQEDSVQIFESQIRSLKRAWVLKKHMRVYNVPCATEMLKASGRSTNR